MVYFYRGVPRNLFIQSMDPIIYRTMRMIEILETMYQPMREVIKTWVTIRKEQVPLHNI